eukprot:10549904-Karenia_brevis.AAC.1
MVKYWHKRLWEVLEDRTHPEDYGEVYECERMLVFMQEPKYNRWGHAFYCMNRDINFDDDDTQFVTLSPNYFNCEACSKPIAHRTSAIAEYVS